MAVIRLPGETLLPEIEPVNVARPELLVNTVVEPISVWPSVLVAAVVPGFEKNWIRKSALGTECRTPWMVVLELPGLTVCKTGKLWSVLGPGPVELLLSPGMLMPCRLLLKIEFERIALPLPACVVEPSPAPRLTP